MNYFTKYDFKNEWLGKSSSLGGYYNQCVTLFKEFLKEAGYPNPGRAIGASGGAREIWYRRIALGYDQYFNFEQVGHPGDWFIWDSVYGWWGRGLLWSRSYVDQRQWKRNRPILRDESSLQ